MKHFLSSLLMLIFSISVLAQNNIYKGTVSNKNNGAAVAFANLIAKNNITGTSTDIDGKFNLETPQEMDTLIISCVGFEKLKFPLKGKNPKDLRIKLTPIQINLDEVVVLPGKNPAMRIIDNAIRRRNKNDYKKLDQWSYNCYENFYVTANTDSIPLEAFNTDTSLQDLKKFTDKQHFFLIENIVEKKYKRPDKEQENIIGTRVSGLKDPIFMMLISKIQSDNFYKDVFAIAGKNYYNPLSSSASKKYVFLLEDTLYNQPVDTTFIISFFPKKNTKFDGLKGSIAINSRDWAIQNVKATPSKSDSNVEIEIQQLFQLINDSVWFPKQLNTSLVFNPGNMSSGSVKVEISMGSDTTQNADQSHSDKMRIVGIGKTYIKDINLTPELRSRDFSDFAVELSPDANKKSKEFWNKYRGDSLSEKETNTYRVIDSIGKEHNFDRLSKGFLTLSTGYIPIRFFDLNINSILAYNDYEGIRLGVGGKTNALFSKWMSLNAYGAYGLSDFQWKYGLGADFFISKRNQFTFSLSHYSDVQPEGGISFFKRHRKSIKSTLFSNLYVNHMNPTESYRAYTSFRLSRHFNIRAGVYHQHKESFKNNLFLEPGGGLTSGYNLSGYEVRLRIAPYEKFYKLKDKVVSQGTKWPIINISYIKGLKDVVDGDYDFNRVDLHIEKSFYTKFIGTTSMNLYAGYIDNPLPRGSLYNANASNRHWGLFIDNTFNTMQLNEFLSDRYVSFFIHHSFGKLLYEGKFFQPEFILYHAAGWGDLSQANLQTGDSFKKMNKGFYEGGLVVDDMLKIGFTGLGAGVFYRYGPYSDNKALNNFVYKLSLSISLNK